MAKSLISENNFPGFSTTAKWIANTPIFLNHSRINSIIKKGDILLSLKNKLMSNLAGPSTVWTTWLDYMIQAVKERLL